MSKETAKAVIETAKQAQEKSDIHTLSSGVRVRIKPVSISLITDAQSRVKYPDPPMYFDERMGREVANSDDPHYQRLCSEVDTARGQVALDASVMFGLELVDGLPQDTTWIGKLKLLGYELDPSDLVSCEFYYKKYIALGGSADLSLILKHTTLSEQGVGLAEDSFPSD